LGDGTLILGGGTPLTIEHFYLSIVRLEGTSFLAMALLFLPRSLQ